MPELIIVAILLDKQGVPALAGRRRATASADAILASVIRSSLDCVIVTDEAGVVVEFNPAAEATFGYSRAEALGGQISELIVPPRLRKAHAKGNAAWLAGGVPPLLGRRVEQTAVRADGTEFPVELRSPKPGAASAASSR